jgi:hypothetical protein
VLDVQVDYVSGLTSRFACLGAQCRILVWLGEGTLAGLNPSLVTRGRIGQAVKVSLSCVVGWWVGRQAQVLPWYSCTCGLWVWAVGWMGVRSQNHRLASHARVAPNCRQIPRTKGLCIRSLNCAARQLASQK